MAKSKKSKKAKKSKIITTLVLLVFASVACLTVAIALSARPYSTDLPYTVKTVVGDEVISESEVVFESGMGEIEEKIMVTLNDPNAFVLNNFMEKTDFGSITSYNIGTICIVAIFGVLGLAFLFSAVFYGLKNKRRL